TWREAESGWIAVPEEIVTALAREGFEECKREMTTSRRDRRPAGGVWQGLNTRTGSVASAIWVNRAAWPRAIIFITVDGEAVGDLAYADVPTAADMIACNEEARDAVPGRTTSPTAKDEARAEDARKGGRNTTERTDATGTITQSPDPQIEGMDARGAKDAAYR